LTYKRFIVSSHEVVLTSFLEVIRSKKVFHLILDQCNWHKRNLKLIMAIAYTHREKTVKRKKGESFEYDMIGSVVIRVMRMLVLGGI